MDAANQPDLVPVRPKGDWTDDKGGVGMGGKGVEFKEPLLSLLTEPARKA